MPVALEMAVAATGAQPAAASSESADDEAGWVRAAARGDRRAFDRLYQRYRKLVHASLVARVPADDAPDLVHDVFLAALRRIGSVRQEHSVGGWLLAIARARAADYWRQARPRGQLPDGGGATSDPPRADAARVLAALRELPDAYSEVLAMRLVEGMTGPEIAARTGLAAGSVRVNLCRGMKLLRSKLGLEVEQ